MSKFVIHPEADIPAMLKDKGYSSYAIRRDHVLGESTMQKFRTGKLPSWAEFAKLVDLLHVSPMALIAWQRNDGAIFDLAGHRLDKPPQPQPSYHPAYIPDFDDQDDDQDDDDTWFNSAPDD